MRQLLPILLLSLLFTGCIKGGKAVKAAGEAAISTLQESEQDQAAEQARQAAEREAEMREKRLKFLYNLNDLVTLNYDVKTFGGISYCSVTVKNNSDYPIEYIKVEISCYLENGNLFQTYPVELRNIGAWKEGLAPGETSGRGTMLAKKITVVTCNGLELCAHLDEVPLTEAAKTDKDPYMCNNN